MTIFVIAWIFNLEFLNKGGIGASRGQECLSLAKIKLITSLCPNNANSIYLRAKYFSLVSSI